MTGKKEQEVNEGAVNEAAVIRKPGSSRENKTGSWRTFRPKIAGRCTGCEICTWFCPDDAIKISEKEGKKTIEIDYDYCKGCLICVEECPQRALASEREK